MVQESGTLQILEADTATLITCRGHLILPFSGAEWTREASKVLRLGRTPGSQQRQPRLVMERGEQKVNTREILGTGRPMTTGGVLRSGTERPDEISATNCPSHMTHKSTGTVAEL